MADDAIIVFAEDNNGLRQTLEALMRKIGYKVHAFENGMEALTKIIELRRDGEIPILVTDCQMPVMDGPKLLQSLQTLEISLPTVMLSSEEDPEKKLEEAGVSVDKTVKKPASIKVIEKAINVAVNRYSDRTRNTPMGHATGPSNLR